MMPNKLIKVSLHVENMKFGKVPDKTKPQLSDFVRLDGVRKDAESKNIDQVGIRLSYTENRALLAVQQLLDETDYKGNTKPVHLAGSSILNLPDEVPCLDVPITKYLTAYGVRKTRTSRKKLEYSAKGRRSALKALKSLACKHFLLIYERKFEEQEKGKTGNSLIEMVAPLVQVTFDKRKLIITPNPVLIDQIDNYFCWYPVDLFTKLVDRPDQAKALFIEYLFCLYEWERRVKQKSKYEIKRQMESIAYALRMDPLLAARQPGRLRTRLNSLYEFAQKIGLLRKYEVDSAGKSVEKQDVLYLNAPYFANQRQGLLPVVAKSITASSDV